jgi:hypothetical protein
MNVPAEQAVKELSPEKIAANAVRLAYEDSIRNAYMKTFISEEQARQLAQQNRLNPDEVWKYLNRAQGNWQEISDFIRTEKNNPFLFPFLAALTEKNLRDIPANYLKSYLQNSKDWMEKKGLSEEVFVPYVLSPHIEWELIQDWRSFFREREKDEMQGISQKNAAFIVDFVKNHVKIPAGENYYNCRISPQGVYELQMADRSSRNIFFVAVCRSWGIPARIETATGKPQYFENGQWLDAVFEPDESPANHSPKAKLVVQNFSGNTTTPGYYTHYTLAYFKDGDFHTLDFEENPLVAKFPYQLELDEGYYRLMVGSRANDGSVFVHTEYFELKGNASHTISVRLPEVEGKLFVKGIVDMNTIVSPDNTTKITLKELSKKKGLMLCFIDPGKEPSNHILQDFPAVQQALEKWGGGILLMTPDDKINQAFDISAFKGLPQQTVWGIDNHRSLLQAVAGALQMDFRENFPLTVYFSRNGGILYSSAGYRIGTGEDVLKIIKMEQQ